MINIASWAGHRGGGDMVLYTTAKTALAGFTRSQALEWGPYVVRVNAISPGLFPDVVTSGEERLQQMTQRAEKIPRVGRIGLHDRADDTFRWRSLAVGGSRHRNRAIPPQRLHHGMYKYRGPFVTNERDGTGAI